jgi:hypothetical protein
MVDFEPKLSLSSSFFVLYFIWSKFNNNENFFLNDSQPPPLRFCPGCCCKRDGEEEDQRRRETRERARARLKRFLFFLLCFCFLLLLLLLLLKMATVCALESKDISSFCRVLAHSHHGTKRERSVDPERARVERKQKNTIITIHICSPHDDTCSFTSREARL